MGAVAAGLIAATGLKLVTALKRNVLGWVLCWCLIASTFMAIAWLRWPLAWVLLGLGGVACVAAYRRLGVDLEAERCVRHQFGLRVQAEQAAEPR